MKFLKKIEAADQNSELYNQQYLLKLGLEKLTTDWKNACLQEFTNAVKSLMSKSIKPESYDAHLLYQEFNKIEHEALGAIKRTTDAFIKMFNL
jgi:hypothetical protein